jgi:hypothetical protein
MQQTKHISLLRNKSTQTDNIEKMSPQTMESLYELKMATDFIKASTSEEFRMIHKSIYDRLPKSVNAVHNEEMYAMPNMHSYIYQIPQPPIQLYENYGNYI